jgi:hypothetical protein
MAIRRIFLSLSLLAVIVGFGGYAFAGQPRYFALVGFIALIASGLLFAFGGASGPPVADDLRRAGDSDYHPISQGPMQRGPS